MHPLATHDRSREGLTLIEIMVVVVIVAMAAAGASMGLGALTRTSLRSACLRVMALSRYGFHRALTHGTTVRMTLDLSSGKIGLSEAHGRITLVRSDAPLRERLAEDEDRGDPGAALDPWAAAQAKLAKPDELAFPPSPFSPITSPSGAAIARFAQQPIGKDVRIVKVIVAHEAEPREEGVTDLFFFPSGLTQHAVVQLADRNQVIFSVEIHPLSGHGTVHAAPFEPEVLIDDTSQRDEKASELEDR